MTWFDKIRLYLIYTVATILIVLAVVFSVLRIVLPNATGYVDDVEQILSEQIGLPVSIASMDADMYWLVPRLKLVDVVIYDKDKQRELLRLDEALFALAFVDSILQLSPIVGDVDLVGADLYIERHANNQWRIQGIDFGGEVTGSSTADSSNELISAIKNTSFSLLNSNIHWQDYRLRDGQLDFIDANIFIEEFLDDHSLEINLQLPEKYGRFLRLIVKTDDDIAQILEADLDVYLQAESIDIGRWLTMLDIADLPSVKGTFNGELWLSRKANLISHITLDAVVENFQLKRKDYGEFSLDGLSGQFEWIKTKGGWEFASHDIYLLNQNAAWPELANISAAQNVEGLFFSSTYLRLQDLIGLADVVLSKEQSVFVKKYQMNKFAGDFYNSTAFISASDSKDVRFSTIFENVDFSVPDSEILFKGVDGSLAYVKDQARIEFLSETVVMVFGSLFRQPLDADLIEGVVFATRENNDWQISAEDLYLLNSDLEINTRLKIRVNEKGASLADIQSDFRDVNGAAIGKYYPLPVMSKDLLDWLDMAITDGFVESGSFIMHGDLSRFPYADNDGIMEVVFDASYLTLNFLEGWPSLNGLSSHIRFHNSSLFINDANGQTYRGELTDAKVLIPDLYAPRLFIDGHVEAPAEDLQQYVWDSGLDDILGAAMKQFQASGNTGLDLELEIPLDNGDAVQARGALQFRGNELYLPVMDYVLDEVNGRLFFDGDQLSANDIEAVFEGESVIIDVMSIDVSDDDEFSANIFSTNNLFGEDEVEAHSELIFNIKGRLPADGMLKKFDWIPKDWVAGASDWDVVVHLPKDTEDYSVRVEMDSKLEGTTISLSDAVSKNSDELLPVNLEIKALFDGLQVDVKSEKNFTLFATRNDESVWDFVVDSSLIRGSGEFAEDLNKDSAALLDLEYIDLLTLFESSGEGGEAVSLKPTFFPSLNFKTKVLSWNDWEFSDVRLDTSWNSHGMLIDSISLHGPSLQIEGKGSWLSSWQNAHESNFNFNVKSDDLGRTLTILDLTKNMKRGDYVGKVNWRWFDEPYRFSWKTVQGNSNFTMKEGEIKAMDPGASGRIVGLLNVFKLFDRLTLDFSDVSGEGFAFDSVEGNFKFQDGHAFAENIEISAAAANMKLTGNIGTVDRDYDLHMQVRPRSSAAAFTGGTLAGGPVLGAGLVLISKLFGLEKSAYDEYEITGVWDDPQIEQIEKHSVEAEVKPEDEE